MGTDGLQPHVPAAIRTADSWLAATADASDAAERRSAQRLAALVSDRAGLDLAVRFVDRVARPEDLHVAAHELAALAGDADAARFVGALDRALLRLGGRLAPRAPGLVVPSARARLRGLVGHLVADTADLTRHIARARAQGFRLNLNLLGEAVLGEREAARRLAEITRLAERADVDYVSVKVSAVASQLVPWDLDGSTARVVDRLLPLYRAAAAHGTFVNLDMEEYHDLDLTVAVFERLAQEDDLLGQPMGIALQAYLPDASGALDEVARIAARRVDAGGARLKVRLVKGANLAMEQVEAQLRGWPQAPYPSKAEVDAHYVRLLDRTLDPDLTRALRVGVASHHLFHLALAHVVATERGVAEAVDMEMLQGMAPAQARAVRDTHGSVLLYTPVVARRDFDVAIAYLVRRLEENSAEQNFLHALVSPARQSEAVAAQRERFIASVHDAATVPTEPRRTSRAPRPSQGPGFRNLPDTDPAVADNRRWAAALLATAPSEPLAAPATSIAEVDAAVARAASVAQSWGATPPARRAEILRQASAALDAARGDLVRAMAHEAGKTVGEADPEVSEAADFAAYYADRAAELADGTDPLARFRPDGVTLVTPPWNFPVAIPIGGALAALAAGSPAILKPAPQTPRCASVAVDAVRSALAVSGVDPDVLQLLQVAEDEVGRHLVTHADIARVVLTGSIETARLFAGWRPDRDVLAETSGKNALVVTPSADLDLAVADAVRSAFGHAGQKCSAASLLILVGSAGRSPRLRRQLADAVSSLAVGAATALGTTMGPLVEPAQGKLLRALTTLDPGEQWLVEPRRLDQDGRRWTPGVKHGVSPGSFFHVTECFGPVLGVMRVGTLDEAIAVQNATAFGLTGGLHSLDPDEIEHWLEHVEVGNAYVNRHITGAVVQRQSFGGWKASVVGPGAKAGGPGYVAQLGTWADAPDLPADPQAWLETALADDARVAATTFAPADRTGLPAEENTLRYRAVGHLWIRRGADAVPVHVERVRAAAARFGVPVTQSSAEAESDEAFAARVRSGEVSGRIRVIGSAPGLREAAAPRAGDVTVLDQPVLASGARELRTVLREQAVSRTRHRFGHLDVT
ncbi:bifunctional proline dehydrogenase/L-glutamate gamma-semialdehyde dehydrogenase [Isoptericola sp. b441]|uniref:L-glutamate gamma-semialdehyde dehydrogenase n=1 Tax=Actinotalea lenta TaxID=3064654 RepID=A0ABT9DA42_9CELL|nr:MULTISPECIES: bifunctional proline dehydrogenase/L-glutamate gamma-semialdehyde dehydrogenase [unclassified Isoptericola]MDO8107780.1 bifunctional proline dehydrogenase/L-glutamate gamma-semialdehyde dehydrogenase [Isoptericola sp. b441]MDO8120549.1 bifunctional proline dehydrogenase/L-glutamate gamma-semialdehyde dehydrogenase [Isoptericola sp. b490]